MKDDNAWGRAFIVAMLIHVAGGVFFAQKIWADLKLQPVSQAMEIEVELSSTTPAHQQPRGLAISEALMQQQRENLYNDNDSRHAPMLRTDHSSEKNTQEEDSTRAAVHSGNEQGGPSDGGSGELAAGAMDATTEIGDGGSGNGPSAFVQEDQPPSIAYKVAPAYPAEARRNRWQGTTLLSVLIEASGAVSDIRVVKSSGHNTLDQAAIEVVSQEWRFNPAYRNGKAIIRRVKVPVAFNLDD
ncbi:energy transducer TonB [Anaerosinus massiliensis]|uniref:energy transducer TonB n=1 Tax=Massilibacillus massiliensis TaxID=1806837 RepID=UPI000DA63BB6|nr:energy transducer TonB [Massilibacillus massiliensis]